MSRRSGPLVWLAQHPRVVLASGCAFAIAFFVLSYLTGKWHWFPRGGALLALSGFIVSVQEALLYLAPREPEYKSEYNPVGYVRSGPYGMPVFHPDFFGRIRAQPDPELTSEEIDKATQEAWDAWNEAGEETEQLVEEGHPGRPMRELSDLTDEEYSRLRLASVFGVIGTFVWAFGDLFGGLPP